MSDGMNDMVVPYGAHFKNTRLTLRGRCQVCGYRFRLRIDRTVQLHHLYSGAAAPYDKIRCAGTGRKPVPRTVT